MVSQGPSQKCIKNYRVFFRLVRIVAVTMVMPFTLVTSVAVTMAMAMAVTMARVAVPFTLAIGAFAVVMAVGSHLTEECSLYSRASRAILASSVNTTIERRPRQVAS